MLTVWVSNEHASICEHANSAGMLFLRARAMIKFVPPAESAFY